MGQRSNITAARLVRERRAAGKKRSLSTYVAKVVEAAKTQDTVTNALRKEAKKLREAGALGKVQRRTSEVRPGVVQEHFRYTSAQVAMIARAYNPRKDETKAARNALIGA